MLTVIAILVGLILLVVVLKALLGGLASGAEATAGAVNSLSDRIDRANQRFSPRTRRLFTIFAVVFWLLVALAIVSNA